MVKDTVKKAAPLSETSLEILEVLKANETPMTLAEIKVTVPKANSAHLVALRTRNLVASEQVEIEVVKTSKVKVLQYAVKGE
jgi:hypothetical protein